MEPSDNQKSVFTSLVDRFTEERLDAFFAGPFKDQQICHQHTTESTNLRDRQTYSHQPNREQEHVTNSP